MGEVDHRAVAALGLEVDAIDATGCVITPGLIDPHEHLLGGSGERGFSTQTPEIHLTEIVGAGITTVVGALGVDTTMKTMAGLLAKVKALREEGMSAFLWTGGYNVPPTPITKSIRDDIMHIAEVIGAGEVAISDARSTDPGAHELARLVNDAYVGGMLSRKAGVTHFHVGERAARLKLLRALIDDYEALPATLYPTHIERNEKLMREATARFKAHIVLKGPDTFISGPDGSLYRHRSGKAGLGTGGSGDVLGGLMGGLLARGASPPQAAAWAVFVHAHAGERLSRRVGPLGFLARELSAEFPGLLAEIGEASDRDG